MLKCHLFPRLLAFAAGWKIPSFGLLTLAVLRFRAYNITGDIMAGRNNAYEEKIVPAFANIKRYLESGLSEKETCELIGVSQSTWYKYKDEVDEFHEFIRSCRRKPIREVEAALMQRAVGYTRTTSKVARVKYVEYDPQTGRKVREGEKLEPYQVTEEVPADVTAGIFLLTNWTRGDYARDAAMAELRRQELEMKKEQGSW